MKLAIFGATGRVGSEVTSLALKDGHQVIALVREPENIKETKGLTVIKGNVFEKEDIEKVFTHKIDGVISALGTDRTTTLTAGIANIILAMEKAAVKRIVTIGTAGILDSRVVPGQYRFQSGESRQKATFAAEEHLKVYQMLKETSLAWTIACPTYLPDGIAEGHYRVEKNVLPIDGMKISVGDTAQFAYEECLNEHFIQARVGLAY